MVKFYAFKNLITNLVKQIVPESKKNRRGNYTDWETDASPNNDFPQQLLQSVQASPVGQAALRVWVAFVRGGGLAVEESANKDINPTQTLGDLHNLWASDISYLDGVALIVKYDVSGEIRSWRHLPFEEARLGIPNEDGSIDRIFHNPYFGIPKVFRQDQTKFFYAYNPDKAFVVRQMAAHKADTKEKDPYPGQAFWFGIEKPLARVYPKPDYYANVNDFQVDAEIPSFHQKNLKNNLLSSVLINMPGDPSAPAGPAEREKLEADPPATLDQIKTVGDVVDESLQVLQDASGGIFLNYGSSEEERATIAAFPTNSHENLFLNLQESTNDHISIGTGVPRILMNIATAGKLGDTQDLLNAVAYMLDISEEKRQILEKIYKEVFQVDGTIKTTNRLRIITDRMWESLTPEERRDHIRKTTEIELAEDVVTEPTPEQEPTTSNNGTS